MVKFKFLTHFPVNHLTDPVVSRLILPLCKFAAFAYYMIDGFILSPRSLHLLFCWVLSILAFLVLTALSCAAIRRDSVSFWKFPFLSFVVWDIVYLSFKPPIEWFSFPFLFPSCCHSVVHRVLSFASGGCNESSFVFFVYSLWVVVSMRLQCCQVLLLPLF